MNISKIFLHRWAKGAKLNGHLLAKKSPGRPPIIQGRDERRLIRVAKINPKLTIKKIAQEANITACHRTIVKVLNRNDLQSWPMSKKSKLADVHIRKQFSNILQVFTMFNTINEPFSDWIIMTCCLLSQNCSLKSKSSALAALLLFLFATFLTTTGSSTSDSASSSISLSSSSTSSSSSSNIVSSSCS